jgi:hypothetical protein
MPPPVVVNMAFVVPTMLSADGTGGDAGSGVGGGGVELMATVEPVVSPAEGAGG